MRTSGGGGDGTVEGRLAALERRTFRYFLEEASPTNGLVPDNSRPGSPCSIAVLGFALASVPVAVERGWIPRGEGAEYSLRLLRFLHEASQSESPEASGHRGFFYHFLDMDTGRRARRSELSTIDSALLFAGALTVASYFESGEPPETEIRRLGEALYLRADWAWALNAGAAISHGWTPERGFLRYRWEGYSEALILYVLALGSPTHPVPPESYDAWTVRFKWKTIYGLEHFYAGPLFIHQMSQLWIDARNIRDEVLREADLDYFENSRRAVLVQREYARRNPRHLRGYNKDCWGLTASDGPGDMICSVDGRRRRFWGYRARGVPFGPDDGTLSPWVVLASLPYAEEAVLETLDHILREYPDIEDRYGLLCSFNPTFPGGRSSRGGAWIADGHYGLNQGPILLMGENHRTGLIWDLMKECPHVVRGLRRAGFRGGWLESM